MIRCIAIDDEPLALKQIQSYVEKIPSFQLIKTFTSAINAIQFLNEEEVDLMFVDINMPDLSGMEFVKSLTNPPKVIFTTAYREYAVEGFQVDAADYLVKPISFPVFSKSLEKTKSRYFSEAKPIEEIESTVKKESDFLFIKTDYKIVRIKFEEIKYIEGMKDYIRIHLVEGKPLMILFSLTKVMDFLPSENFLRVHRSYIVNLNEIVSISRNRIYFDGDVVLPVSDQYKESFQEFINKHFLK
ncbi:LytR/AlgR family response regulator transcription factor [Flammeovirga aprica]|uniref:LytR/AlgR family response regulator transcription factor n=1 Tax=Flammeovirga aprica TaxID=29528 RepID=UPI001981F43B|nr:LytTR family DNA-binding domain-containing protein [Flammeovirga aprica]